MDGTAAVGTSLLFSRQDHVHPSDTSRAPINSPGLTGTPTAPTAAVGTNTTQIATTAFVRQNFGSPATNLIINGDFRINQVGYVSAAALSAGTYGHDQWKAGATGGDYSFTQLKSSTQITIASGKSLIQPVEDVNVAGGSYVLSWTGTAQARAGVNTLTPSGSYAGSPLLITGQTAGTVMSIEFNSGTLVGVKLESGASATPFIMRPYEQELQSCRRYYHKRSVDIIQSAFASGASVGAWFFHPVQMRAAPTVSSTGGTLTNATTQGLDHATVDGYRHYLASNAVGDTALTGGVDVADARL
jgi:hypothetical protein